MKHFSAVTILAAFAIPHVWAQAPCPNTSLTGIVLDSSRAIVPGATITMDEGQSTTSGSDGSFVFRCVDTGPHHLVVAAPGFAQRDLTLAAPHPTQLALTLVPETVETQIEVDSNEGGR